MGQLIIGVDPSRKGNHEICLIGSDLNIIHKQKVKGNQAAIELLKELVALARQGPKPMDILIGIEHTDGTLLEDALQVGAPVYDLAPAKVALHIGSLKCGGDKSDAIDAYGNARYLAAAHPKLEAYQPPSLLVRRARDVSHQLSAIRQQSTKTWQRFWAVADRSAPELKEVLGDSAKTQWFLGMMSDLFPKPRFRHTTAKGFCQCCHKRKSRMKEEELTSILASLKTIHDREMPELLGSQAVTLLTLMREENLWVKKASRLLEQWTEGQVALTVTCLGPKTLIRLLAYIGEDWADIRPAAICAYSGIAPVVHSSGTPPKKDLRRMGPKKRKRHEPRRSHRLACNRDLKTTLCLFAFTTLERSQWARQAYDRFRERGQTHWEALRNLSIKWVRIICAVIRTQKPYDAHYYERNLAARQDPLVAH